MNNNIKEIAEIIATSKSMIAFTGAGISVESGIPPFRGENGLWSKYDPKCLDLGYFNTFPEESWKVIKTIFYDFWGKAVPNKAHQILAQWERKNLLKAVVTQNIDNLHQAAGSKNIYEFHGTLQQLVCRKCGKTYAPMSVDLNQLPPCCPDDESVLKPDFVFFGEGIPQKAYELSMQAARQADVVLVIGTTGEVVPASLIPHEAKRNGATIIEINLEPSTYTNGITDFFLQEKVSKVLEEIDLAINN